MTILLPIIAICLVILTFQSTMVFAKQNYLLRSFRRFFVDKEEDMIVFSKMLHRIEHGLQQIKVRQTWSKRREKKDLKSEMVMVHTKPKKFRA